MKIGLISGTHSYWNETISQYFKDCDEIWHAGDVGEIQSEKPDIFICGHSHILRAMPDEKHGNLLYLNPGAAGNQGFHKIRTMMRFEINKGKVEKFEVIELGKRGG